MLTILKRKTIQSTAKSFNKYKCKKSQALGKKADPGGKPANENKTKLKIKAKVSLLWLKLVHTTSFVRNSLKENSMVGFLAR